mgnify:CR=1 FL=1
MTLATLSSVLTPALQQALAGELLRKLLGYAAIIVGLGLFAAHKAYEHFTPPRDLEDRSGGAVSAGC